MTYERFSQLLFCHLSDKNVSSRIVPNGCNEKERWKKIKNVLSNNNKSHCGSQTVGKILMFKTKI